MSGTKPFRRMACSHFRGHMAKLNKHLKRTIIAFVVILILAAIGVGVAFGIFNNLKFMSYTNAKLVKLAQDYPSHSVNFIAHRGLSREEYQNTREAFELAAEDDSVWGIETDVWATRDGGFVCMHDKNALDGIDNVRDVTLEVALRTPLRHDKQKFAPSFDEYLEICKRGGKTAVIEVKDEDMTEADLDLIIQKTLDSEANFRIISFHFDKLKYVRGKLPDAKLQYLTVDTYVGWKKLNEAISLRIDLSCMYQLLTAKAVKKFHEAGLEVGVWTVNSARDAMCIATKFGVDYITTDVRMAHEIDSFIAGLKK